MAEESSGNAGSRKWWWPFLWIVVASAAAHLWCLGSQFYLDDRNIILENAAIRSGHPAAGLTNWWTYFGYGIEYRLFGDSPVGWHAVNWLLHTAAACVLFAVGRELMRERGGEGGAGFAALLFAVHPLASEIPNYVRTQDLAWVTLFSLLGCRAVIGFLSGGGVLWLLGAALALAGATMSKGPGIFHAAMMMGAVGWLEFRKPQWDRVKRGWPWIAGLAAAGVAVLWVSGVLPNFWRSAMNLGGERFLSHGYTLARVFWEFAWRSLLPIHLCSDHQIAETLISPQAGWLGTADTVAKWSAAGMLLLLALGGWLAWRKNTRLFGVCAVLFVATILFRVLYVVPEFMPEYRIYPGLPWFCLGAAALLGALWKRLPGDGSPRVIAVLILLPFIALSARRSFVWHDLDRLCADVLKSYPAQGRAVWELHDRDEAKGDWQKIIDRQQTVWPGVVRSFVQQYERLKPVRDLNSGHFIMAEIACDGGYAIAISHTRGSAAGVAEIRKTEARLHQLGVRPDDNRAIWAVYHHDRAVVLELAGDYPGALESMRFEGVLGFSPADIDRLERKIAEKQP